MNVLCTIITSDYINYALALRESYLPFSSDTPLHILVTSEDNFHDGAEEKYPGVVMHTMEELCATGIGKAIYDKYAATDMDAFRWSMKPVLINHLLKKDAVNKVIFLDCDIHFYKPFDFLWDLLDTSNVVLSPHWRASNPPEDPSNFFLLYTNGLYNGGFVAANKAGMAAMDWWAMACEYVCIKATERGLFVDQVHLNLIPVYFERVGILRHKGCNVANWNMVECKRILAGEGSDEVLINGTDPIVFVHFTQSTIKGAVWQGDPLLKPYLLKYFKSVNKFSTLYNLKQLTLPVPPPPSPVKQDRLRPIKKLVKKVIGRK